MIKRWKKRRRIIQAANRLVETAFAQDFRDRVKALNDLCEAVE